MRAFFTAVSLFLLTAWSLPEAHVQANKTLVEIGDWCSGTVVNKTKGYVVTAEHCITPVKTVVHFKTKYPYSEAESQTLTIFGDIAVTQRKIDDEGNELGSVVRVMKVLKYDAKHDVAILENTSSIPFDYEAKINTKPVHQGDHVYTIGNPMLIPQVVAQGDVIKAKFSVDVGGGPVELIMYDAYTAGGSSGGGLWNEDGEMIGLTNQGWQGGPHLASPIINMVNLLNG